MATSSIFADFNIYDSVKADLFVETLGKAEKAAAKRPFVPETVSTLKNKREISALLRKASATLKKDRRQTLCNRIGVGI